MERWFTPIVTDQNLTVHFKIKDLAWTWKDDWTPIVTDQDVTANFKFKM